MIIINLVGEKSWPFIEFPLGESVRLWALTLTQKRGGGEGVQQARKGSGEKEKQLVPLSSQPRCVRQERWEVQGQQAGLTCRGVSYFRLPTVISYWGRVKILPAHMSWWGINSSSPSRQIQDLCWRFLKEPGLDVRLKDHTDNQPESHPGPTILRKHASWVCSLLASSRNHSRADTTSVQCGLLSNSPCHARNHSQIPEWRHPSSAWTPLVFLTVPSFPPPQHHFLLLPCSLFPQFWMAWARLFLTVFHRGRKLFLF